MIRVESPHNSESNDPGTVPLQSEDVNSEPAVRGSMAWPLDASRVVKRYRNVPGACSVWLRVPCRPRGPCGGQDMTIPVIGRGWGPRRA